MIWEIDDGPRVIEGLDAAGNPDPEYAAALGLLRAPYGRRILATVYDLLCWVVIQLPFWFFGVPLLLKLADGSISLYGLVNHPGFVLAVVGASVTVGLTLAFSVVQWAIHGRKGMTIGKAITGIRSVNVRTLERPGMWRVLGRFIILGLAGIIPVVGSALMLASPTLDPERRGRGLHDKAAALWLVDARKGLNPYDNKRMRVARKLVTAAPASERAELPSLATPTDAASQPQYRPGKRVSAGVLGVARSYDAHERPEVGLPQTTSPTAPQVTEVGQPVFGGYRPAEEQSAPSDPVLRGQPVAASAPALPEPVPAAPTGFALRLDTGELVSVADPVLLGRSPDDASHPGARPLALADDSRSLSKTHALVQPSEGGLAVTDCGSTNGSALIRGGQEYPLTPGAALLAVEGDILRLGDRAATVVGA